MEAMKKTLAEELRTLRANRKVSLREVEVATRISNAYLSQLEHGEATNPSPHKLHKLAEYYDVQYEYLMQLAGYIREDDTQQSSLPPVEGRLHQLLMSAQLTPEEEDEVADHIRYICWKRKGG